VARWLAAPGPALIDVVTDRYELVMPPKVAASQIFGTALYSAKAVLAGRSEEVVGLFKNALT
jgi:pyruvate dehydrogenase (quinone)